MEFFTYTLSNGIRCILKRIKSPVAYCAVTVNAGTRDEMADEFGLAHFTEHCLFKGTERRKAYHINSRLEKLGGELNAFTTKEETVIHATTLKTDIAKAVELISDIIFNSVFPEKEVEKEREVILDEINSYKDSPADRIYDEFEDMVFAGSTLGHNILGNKKLVSKFCGADIEKYVKRCYNTDQMVFSVAANITEKTFVNIAERFFGDATPSVRTYDREKTQTPLIFDRSFNRGTYQAHCILGGRTYDLHNPNRVALSLLINILGGPAANSILNTTLREKYGLTYNVEASYTPYSDTAVAAIYFGTDKDKVDRCMELINAELNKLKNQAMSPRRFSMAKKQFIGQLSVSMENKEAYMLGAGKSFLVYNEVDSPETIYRKIQSITPSDIMKVANDTFSNISKLVYNGRNY